jgi:two-component sensor histidine kinase
MTFKASGAPMPQVLPFVPASAAVARHELDQWLAALDDCDERCRDECALVMSELVGNALRHARPLANGAVEVSWRRTPDGVELAVSDGGGGGMPHKVDAGLSDLGGRGLAIVEALAGRWWVERSGSRTTVHALLPARRHQPMLTGTC